MKLSSNYYLNNFLKTCRKNVSNPLCISESHTFISTPTIPSPPKPPEITKRLTESQEILREEKMISESEIQIQIWKDSIIASKIIICFSHKIFRKE